MENQNLGGDATRSDEAGIVSTGANMSEIGGAIEKYLEHSSQTAAQSDQNQQMLAERQQAMMEFIQKSNEQLTDALTRSQATVQAQQLQAALQQVGNLFTDYQMRTRDLQEELKSAQPSEVVVDVSEQMTANSDELIQQILDKLQAAQQNQENPAPEQPEE